MYIRQRLGSSLPSPKNCGQANQPSGVCRYVGQTDYRMCMLGLDQSYIDHTCVRHSKIITRHDKNVDHKTQERGLPDHLYISTWTLLPFFMLRFFFLFIV